MRSGRIKSLDGLRGIAILLVLGYHAVPSVFPGGFLGVDLFFVLSGYLITTLLLGEYQRTGRISLRAFWRRRVRRLLPASMTALLVVVLVGALTSDPYVNYQIRLFVVSALTATTNIAAATGRPLYATYTWSLSAEEQFYLVWPLILIGVLPVIARGRWSTWRVVLGLLIALAAVELFRTISFAQGVGWSALYYSPIAHMDGLLVGCVLAFVAPQLPRRLAPTCAFVGTAAMLALSLRISVAGSFLYTGGYVLVVVASGLAVFGASVMGAGWLSFRPLVFTGRISYSLYIWNSLVLLHFGWSTFDRLLGVAVSVVIAACSYLVLERRALKTRGRYETPLLAF